MPPSAIPQAQRDDLVSRMSGHLAAVGFHVFEETVSEGQDRPALAGCCLAAQVLTSAGWAACLAGKYGWLATNTLLIRAWGGGTLGTLCLGGLWGDGGVLLARKLCT